MASGAVFVQRFAFDPEAAYPDDSSVEFWHNGLGRIHAFNKEMVMAADAAENPYVFESEVLSPFAQLEPGESYTWDYQWYATNIGGDFPVLGCSDAGLVAVPLSAVFSGDKLQLAGRFGVFGPGRLDAELLTSEGRTLQRLPVVSEVSPLRPVIVKTDFATSEPPAIVRLVFTPTSDSISQGTVAEAQVIHQ